MQILIALSVLTSSLLISLGCKTVSAKPSDRRNSTRLEPPPLEAIAQEGPAEPAIKQSVTQEDIQSAPPIPTPVTSSSNKGMDPKVMVPEAGSECKQPVTANCLKIPYPVAEVEVLNLSPDVIRKYSRQLSPAEHKCPYFDQQLPAWGHISYFPDAILYWSDRDESSVIYNSLPINFIFSAGCEVGGEILNPYDAELKSTSIWDGTTTLKSLGYKVGVGQPLPSTFAADKLKAEKVTQASQACGFAVRPLIYVFPDGAIYQFVGATTINVYPMTQIKAIPCSTPPGMQEAIETAKPRCESSPPAAAPSTGITLKSLGFKLRDTNSIQTARTFLNQDLLDTLIKNGKQIGNSVLECPFASRSNVLQFSDGIVFIKADCSEANIYTNNFVASRPCKIPAYP